MPAEFPVRRGLLAAVGARGQLRCCWSFGLADFLLLLGKDTLEFQTPVLQEEPELSFPDGREEVSEQPPLEDQAHKGQRSQHRDERRSTGVGPEALKRKAEHNRDHVGSHETTDHVSDFVTFLPVPEQKGSQSQRHEPDEQRMQNVTSAKVPKAPTIPEALQVGPEGLGLYIGPLRLVDIIFGLAYSSLGPSVPFHGAGVGRQTAEESDDGRSQRHRTVQYFTWLGHHSPPWLKSNDRSAAKTLEAESVTG